MQGRIYDPGLGRFLQADPFVQAPDNSQNLNRYSYVLNNPLSYTDPNGFFFKSLIGSVSQTVFTIAGCSVPGANVVTCAATATITSGMNSAANDQPFLNAVRDGAIAGVSAGAFSQVGAGLRAGNINEEVRGAAPRRRRRWLAPPPLRGIRHRHRHYRRGRGLYAFLAWTERGFTGHESIQGAGIVHMQGRIYDPGLGRFLQADPFVQAPDNSQNLNRYAGSVCPRSAPRHPELACPELDSGIQDLLKVRQSVIEGLSAVPIRS